MQKKLLETVSPRFPKIIGTPSLSEYQEIRKFHALLLHAATLLGVELPLEHADDSSMPTLYADIQIELEKMRINIELADTPQEQRGLLLDETWRSRVHAYVFHIRQVIERETGIGVRLREAILRKLNDFEGQVDRGRARIEILTAAFVDLCAAASDGAASLRPALRLAESLIGSLTNLTREVNKLLLPSPETLALPEPDPSAGGEDDQLP